MAVSVSPHYVMDSWTELPKNTGFEVTSARLQVLLLNIFQVLQLECNSSFATESDLQEAMKLISKMNALNAEMEKKLQDTELHICESDRKITTETETLKEQLASMKTQLEIMTEDKRHLQSLVAKKEENLAAAVLEREKLERLVESLQIDLEAEKKRAKRSIEPHEEALLERLLFQKYAQDSYEKEPMQSQSVNKNLEIQEQKYKECLTINEELQQQNRNLESQVESLTEQTLSLEATLNISALNISILEGKLKMAEQINSRYRNLEQQFRNTLMTQKVINYTQFINQSCNCPSVKNLSAVAMKLQTTLTSHYNVIMTFLATQYGARKEPSNLPMLRSVLKGRTLKHALSEDSKKGDVVAVSVLLNSHINPNRCDSQGFTPLHWSALKGHIAVAELLLQYGGIIDVDQRLRDCMDITPLHLSVLAGDVQIAQLLLELGADVNAQTRDGSSPLHLAVKEGNDNMIRLLMSYGADTHLRNFKGLNPKDLAEAKNYDLTDKIL